MIFLKCVESIYNHFTQFMILKAVNIDVQREKIKKEIEL